MHFTILLYHDSMLCKKNSSEMLLNISPLNGFQSFKTGFFDDIPLDFGE